METELKEYQKQYLNWFRFQNLFPGFDFIGVNIKQDINKAFIDKNAYTNFKNVFLIYGMFFFL